jgi:hypothetical protein
MHVGNMNLVSHLYSLSIAMDSPFLAKPCLLLPTTTITTSIYYLLKLIVFCASSNFMETMEGHEGSLLQYEEKWENN